MIVPFHFGKQIFGDVEWLCFLNAATWAYFPSLQQISILFLNTEFRKRFFEMFLKKSQSYTLQVSVAVLTTKKTSGINGNNQPMQ
ncbi:hypothetical protein L596_030511 [Steinernema carpocapsae]|uniref:7TM GPCR serpentine receptor class x (Srx) domain-containing protein n=1 Tax=Steinernema carpocapsae TaxID=34508 RepID=A0A4U5LPL4_STECR|nr:hypothetical protein L596_030511 [Steinernema carpocapsae]